VRGKVSLKKAEKAMGEDYQHEIQALLMQSKIGFLATQGKNGAETSMAPFALDRGVILLHLSKLARHTVNIERDPKIGLMICTPETDGASPLSLPRLSLQGEVSVVNEDQYQAAQAAYVQQIPDAEMLFSFADFTLFQLSASRIHWVGGFGKARKVPLEQWQRLAVRAQGSET